MRELTEIRCFDVLPGAWVDPVIEEASDIAKKHDCIVKFTFNGIEMTVSSYESMIELKSKYTRLVEEKR